MSDERPDEFFSWRSRLSPPDALPEQGLDSRDLTWEKLARRLGKAPGQDSVSHASSNSAFARLRSAGSQPLRHRLPVYRIAAACLLLLLIPAALLFQDRPTHTPQQPNTNTTTSPKPGTLTAQSPAQPSAQPPAQAAAQPAPLILRPAEASPIIRSGPTPKELARLRPINNKTQPAQTTSEPHSRQTPAAKSPDSLPPPTLTAGLIPDHLSPVPPQKTLKNNQLRIVHINELDNPNNLAPAMTSIRSREPDIRVLIILKNH